MAGAPIGGVDKPFVKHAARFPVYAEEVEKYKTTFEGERYKTRLQDIKNRKETILPVYVDDCEPSLQISMVQNGQRYAQLAAEAADDILRGMVATEPIIDATPDDVWERHRNQQLASAGLLPADENKEEKKVKSPIPAIMSRRFEVRLIPSAAEKPQKLRDVKAAEVGHLIQIRGIVTRSTDVQPLVKVVTYLCDHCGHELYQEVIARQFTPLRDCSSPECQRNQVKGKVTMQVRGSKFVKYQEVKVQELPEEVPVGHIPRSITLKCFGEVTRQCKPGDIITVAGLFLPQPRGGFRAMKAGLTADVYIEAHSIETSKKTYKDFIITSELDQQVIEMSQEKDIYAKLAQSIAPEIYGMTDVKKALVLLLTSGVTRHLPDGMKIRGDINALLMGDPGVAKSQLLKHIAHVAPRGIYTTGKGSSGVGLTAAVIRDQYTGEMTLEGGALVLADMGICCIDEFDKMEEGDRTAIHEVMEQQTVSIAKAGITTTLNARTSVLAAANPVYGRWNKRVSAEKNLGLPAALLSRFDLTFILVDKPDAENDENLARHVTHVHRENKHPALDFEPFSAPFLRAYIAKARQLNPFIDKALTDFIVGSYVGMRKENDELDRENKSLSSHTGRSLTANTRQRFCTARSLLSILRLSQAMARVHLRDVVEQADVEEAMRLLYVAKQTGDDDGEKKSVDPTSAIFKIFRQEAEDTRKTSINVEEIRGRIIRANYSDDDIKATLEAYETMDVWHVSRKRDVVTFLQGQLRFARS